MADSSMCGPKPVPSDYLKPNGNIKWKAYNKANGKWTACVRTSIRKSEENVAARAEAAASIGGSAAELGVGIANAVASTQGGTPLDLTGGSDAPPPSGGMGQYLPWIAGAGALYLLVGGK